MFFLNKKLLNDNDKITLNLLKETCKFYNEWYNFI